MHAILYDVHGNLPALEAVLADAESAGADNYVLGGDYALFGAWPLQTGRASEGSRRPLDPRERGSLARRPTRRRRCFRPSSAAAS